MGRRGISTYVATLLLIMAAFVLGGVLFTHLRSMVIHQLRTPSLMLVDYYASEDRTALFAIVKNDGNVPLSVSKAEIFDAEGKSMNVTQISPITLRPGEVRVLTLKLNGGAFGLGVQYVMVITADHVTKAFPFTING